MPAYVNIFISFRWSSEGALWQAMGPGGFQAVAWDSSCVLWPHGLPGHLALLFPSSSAGTSAPIPGREMLALHASCYPSPIVWYRFIFFGLFLLVETPNLGRECPTSIYSTEGFLQFGIAIWEWQRLHTSGIFACAGCFSLVLALRTLLM